MTNKIEEIRNRHKRLEDMRSSTYPDEISDSWTYFGHWAAHHDRAFLLAEDERHREEIERLTRERDEARAEVARMMKLHTPPADIPWPARDLRALPYQTAAGCMCPAEANLHCQNSFCPRRNPPGVITCQGGKP